MLETKFVELLMDFGVFLYGQQSVLSRVKHIKESEGNEIFDEKANL